jgi:hypothetical protein
LAILIKGSENMQKAPVEPFFKGVVKNLQFKPIAITVVSDPKLIGASVSFHTNDEDKDGDTHVTVTIRKNDGTIVARVDNDFGHFNDHTDAGPFGLKVVNAIPKSTLAPGYVTIRIDPNGHDTWRFNFSISLLFADGSSIGTEEDGLVLSQDRQQQTFGLSTPY